MAISRACSAVIHVACRISQDARTLSNTPRMAGEHELSPKKRDDRKKRNAGSPKLAAGAVHDRP
jgi:hypothetical protein